MEIEQFKRITYGDMVYEVGNFGTIVGKKGVVKQRLNKDGYIQVTLGKDKKRTSVLVHRLVASYFIPNPYNLPEVNHKDYNRANPRYDNLEWVIHKSNVNHSSSQGRYKERAKGVNNGRARVNENAVREIRLFYNKGLATKSELARIYSIGWSTVHNIAENNTWKHIKD